MKIAAGVLLAVLVFLVMSLGYLKTRILNQVKPGIDPWAYIDEGKGPLNDSQRLLTEQGKRYARRYKILLAATVGIIVCVWGLSAFLL
jgi:hypothetical protein